MTNILFIESGVRGGGSFESLYQHLKAMDRAEFNPSVVYLNKTRYFNLVRDLGIFCQLIQDPLYSLDMNMSGRVRWFLERFKTLIDILFPFMSLIMEKRFHSPTIQKINDIVVRENIKLIHTNNQVNRDLYAVISAEQTEILCIAHLRSFFSKGFNGKKAEYVNNNVQRFIAYSHSVAEHWEGRGIDPRKMATIYNAIGDVSADPVDLHKQYQLPKDTNIIGIVGSIIPVRGHEFLFRAFSALREVRKQVVLLVLGDGEKRYVHRLKGLAKTLGIRSSVIFVGPSDDAKGVIASLDVLVMPYSIEPFGRVLLEAWCLRIPVVATDIGNIFKIVAHGINGILVRYGDVEGLKDALLEILDRDEMRRCIAETAYKDCRKKHSIESYCRQIQGIYKSVMNCASSAGDL